MVEVLAAWSAVVRELYPPRVPALGGNGGRGQNERMRKALVAVLLVPLLLAGCGRKNAAVLPDSWEVSLARAGEAWIAKDWARTWSLCENAFTIAAKTKALAPSLLALDCLGETAVKQEQPGKALPFYAKFLADHRGAMATHTARFRIRNNHAVLLHGSGKADEAVAELREVVAAAESGPINYPVFLALVRNLAIAWYGSASSPEAKAWVRETGTWLQERLGPDAASRIGGHRGATRALEALIAIGERQALEETPPWRRLVEETRGLEEDLDRQDPIWRRLCETIKLGEIGLVACMRELSP